jgi:type IV pilus assembly protein PilE
MHDPRIAPLHRSRRSRMLGVTLLELMAVVTVIGILGMIAVPSYRQYVMRAQRIEAKAALLRLQTSQERFYLTHRTYSADPDALGFAGDLTDRGTYALSIAGADANGYAATATPRAGAVIDMTRDVQCTSFSLTAQGVRSATGTGAASCW